MAKTVGKGGEVGVIYIRAPQALLAALAHRVKVERRANPYRAISQSDVARELLWGALFSKEEAER